MPALKVNTPSCKWSSIIFEVKRRRRPHPTGEILLKCPLSYWGEFIGERFLYYLLQVWVTWIFLVCFNKKTLTNVDPVLLGSIS